MNENGMVYLPPIPTRITDPATLRLMAEQLVATVEDRVDPQPEEKPVEVALEQAPAMPKIYRPHAGRMSRLRNWIAAQVATPGRFKRFLLWTLTFPARVWSFVKVVTSRRVSLEEYAWRENACRDCPFRHYRIREDRTGFHLDEHCSKCGCPDWRMSRNEVRNWYSGWRCPARRHPGPYPDDAIREFVQGQGYDPETVFGGGGCTGCGCGKAGKQGG